MIQYNQEFFSIPNKINSYWAGFIAADGNIHKNLSDISVNLGIRDKDNLERLASALEYGGTIKIRKDKKAARLRWCRTQNMAEDLSRHYNITPQKTCNLKFPRQLTNQEHMFSFIAGFIDGDGWVTNDELTLGVIGTKSMIDGIQEHLSLIHPHVATYTITARPHVNTFQIQIGKKASISISDYMRTLDLPLMGRKWDKFLTS